MSDENIQTGIVENTNKTPRENPSVVTVGLVGCGGAGINTARNWAKDPRLSHHLYFDTSITNTRYGERCNVLTSGLGSGANRSENAAEITRVVPQLSDADIGLSDVMIVLFSLGGGSGSVIAPLMMREYNRRGARVIGLCISDTSYSVAADNTLNTLKTLTAVANNNNIYLPLVILSNDAESSRRPVDEAASAIIDNILDLLTTPVFEIDQNDRLNWINPTKVISTQSGLKILSTEGGKPVPNISVVLGGTSTDMVDSVLVLHKHDEAQSTKTKNLARLKKVGIYYNDHEGPMLVGTVSSDISDITGVINLVERMRDQERAQTHAKIDKLQSSGNDDLIL